MSKRTRDNGFTQEELTRDMGGLLIGTGTDRIGEYELEEEDSPGSGTSTWNLTGEAFFLQYNRARYYRPDHGRWIARDPAGYVDGMNLYEYAGSGIVKQLDPYGLFHVDIPIAGASTVFHN